MGVLLENLSWDQAGHTHTLCRSSAHDPLTITFVASLPLPLQTAFRGLYFALTPEGANGTHHSVCNWVTTHSTCQRSICEPPSEEFLSIWVFSLEAWFLLKNALFCSFIYFSWCLFFGFDHWKLSQTIGPASTSRTSRAPNTHCTTLSPMLILHLHLCFWVLTFGFCFYFSIIICILKSL